MKQSRELRLYAHRGAGLELPENTLPAFELALSLGANALEMDVHLTRDGKVIVAHDPTGKRMANTDAKVAELDLQDVQRWDVGWGLLREGERPFSQQGYQVPTLDAVLATHRRIPINIDIKADGVQAVERTIEVIRAHGAEERVTLASFVSKNLWRIRKAGFRGDIALGQPEVVLLGSLPEGILALIPFLGSAAQLPTRGGPFRFDDRGFIAKAHAVGMRVDFWTINEREEAVRLLSMGADGIMTDDPRTMQGILDRFTPNA